MIDTSLYKIEELEQQIKEIKDNQIKIDERLKYLENRVNNINTRPIKYKNSSTIPHFYA